MKKILFILLLASIILPAFSDAIWEEIQSKDKLIYVDTSSITNQDAQYLYWVKSANQNGYRKMLMKSDCSNNLTGVQKVIVYDENDKMIKSDDLNQELSYVVPDSDAQAVYNYVCSMHKESEKKQNRAQKFNNRFNNGVNVINNTINGVNSVRGMFGI